MTRKQKQTAILSVGERVWVERLHDHGVIFAVSPDGRRVDVDFGRVRFNLDVSCLAPAREKRRPTAREGGIMRPPPRARMAPEIDMHGLRVEAMLVRLDQFLNDALLAGLDEVRIIHGHGSGALKKALHQRLKAMGIGHFRLGEPGQTPGGDAVTILSFNCDVSS